MFRTQGWTPLHHAAKNGHTAICDLITSDIQEKNPMTNHGWTPLHSAAEGGHLPICEMLRQNMPNKNPRDDRGFTPLHWAACYGNLSVCELIINDLQVKYFNSHMHFFLSYLLHLLLLDENDRHG